MPILSAFVSALLQSTLTPAADLSWMSGYWLDCAEGREVSETWSDPRAGLMVGHNLTVSASGQAGFEAAHIMMTPGGFAYIAQPDGAPPTTFFLSESGQDSAGRRFVVFSNLTNDFPHHIRYEAGGDALEARIDGVIEGQARSMKWNFKAQPLNARCPR